LHAYRMPGEPDFLSEWSSIECLGAIKKKFPSLTTTASAKWLPADVLVSEKYEAVLEDIARLLKDYAVDTVCMNVPDSTFSDKALRTFLQQNILSQVGVDRIDVKQLSEMYIGETDRLEFTSRSDVLCDTHGRELAKRDTISGELRDTAGVRLLPGNPACS